MVLLPGQLLQDFPVFLRALGIGSEVRLVGLRLIFHDFLPFLCV